MAESQVPKRIVSQKFDDRRCLLVYLEAGEYADFCAMARDADMSRSGFGAHLVRAALGAYYNSKES